MTEREHLGKISKEIEESPAREQWKKIGIAHHHGIDIALFSLRSNQSGGIGEFPDLLPMIDWCHHLGLDCLQLLPLNDTGNDSSPYGAVSAFALNPIYIGLSRLPNFDKHMDLQSQLKELQKQNASQRVNYLLVRIEKERIFHAYLEREKKEILEEKEFLSFKENNPWLKSYALFKSIKISSGWQSWTTWPQMFKEPNAESFTTLTKQFSLEIEFLELEQFFCAQQLKEVKKSASKLGVFIKGDIPILISKESVDVWQNPSLFRLDLSAGAPPDYYSKKGQNWDFPVYNWDIIKRKNYQWWKDRLKVATQFYDIYRIDHAVGFFRIWAIPLGKEGNEGFYIPEDQQSWMKLGEENMRMMLQSSIMLPIAEDLGNVPQEVKAKLSELGILGTKVMRWERRWKGDQGFISPQEYPPLSMTTVSTHDSETLQLWWKNSREEAEEFCRYKNWEYQPDLSVEKHKQILWDSHHSASLFHINLLNEYLALFPNLIWPNSENERINIPGTISETNWTYRFRPSIEEIVSHQELADTIKELIK